jgi:hypothetical protein
VVVIILFSLPAGFYWCGRTISLRVQSLNGGAFAGEGPFIHDGWDAPTGEWAHGSLYGIKLGNKLLRLDVTYNPVADINQHLPRTLDGLLAASNSKNPLVQQCVVRAITAMGTRARPAVPILLKRCEQGDPFAEWAVIEVAKAVGPEAVPFLTETLTNLTNHNPALVSKAVEALGEMQTNAISAVTQLAQLLTNAASTNILATAYALSKIEKRDHGEIQALSRLLASDDHAICLGAVFILGEFGPVAAPAAPSLLEFMARAAPLPAGWCPAFSV